MNRVHLMHQDPSKLPGDFWTSAAGEVLVIQRWADERPEELKSVASGLPVLRGHVWVASSGTLAAPGTSKWVAVSKEALLASAEAVNKHLSLRPEDEWALTLPLAHVGGLGIIARARLLGQKVVAPLTERWDPHKLVKWNGELLSLVPTQVHDLVRLGLPAPSRLRVVVVGGDRLAPELLQAARALGWPLRPSYGLTECCSQVATALPGDEGVATLLPHIRATTDPDGRLWISSPSLYTGMARVSPEGTSFEERPSDPWGTEDLAELEGSKLRILGRRDAVIKVRGEKVELPQLEAQLQLKAPGLVLIPLEDERDGHALWAVSEALVALEDLNQGLLPHQKIRGVSRRSPLPRTNLGKIKRGELKQWLKDEVAPKMGR